MAAPLIWGGVVVASSAATYLAGKKLKTRDNTLALLLLTGSGAALAAALYARQS